MAGPMSFENTVTVKDSVGTVIAAGGMIMKFTGSVVVSQIGPDVVVNVGAGGTINVEQNGVAVLSTGTLNFIGASVVNNAGKADITISSLGGGAPNRVAYFNALGTLITSNLFRFTDTTHCLELTSGGNTLVSASKTIILGNTNTISSNNSLICGTGSTFTSFNFSVSASTNIVQSLGSSMTRALISGNGHILGASSVLDSCLIVGSSHSINLNFTNSCFIGHGHSTTGVGFVTCAAFGTGHTITGGIQNTLLCGRGNVNPQSDALVCGTFNENISGRIFQVGIGTNNASRLDGFYVTTQGDVCINRKPTIKEGLNKCMGQNTLVAGSVVVNTNQVTATSRIMLTAQNPGTAQGEIYISARNPGVSFTISSTNAADDRDIAWIIFDPGV